MGSIASSAIRYGSRRTRELLFRPFDARFALRSWLRLCRDDPRSRELRRLRPYYTGTRALSWTAVLLAIPPFIIPFTAPFIGFGGVLYLLAIYIAVFIAVNVLGTFVEVSVDPIMALRHEKGISVYDAAGIFFGFVRRRPVEAVKYMGAKLVVDGVLISVTLLFYMPAMLMLIWLLSDLVQLLTAHAPNVAMTAIPGFIAVIMLGAAAVFCSMVTSVPASAFYGYYTEEAIRHMGNG